MWSRGRYFSPSLSGSSYQKLGSKSDHRDEISGNIVRYDALAPRPGVLRSFSCFYANALVALRALMRIQFSVQAFVFFCRLPSAEAAGNIVRGRVFEGLSLCI